MLPSDYGLEKEPFNSAHFAFLETHGDNATKLAAALAIYQFTIDAKRPLPEHPTLTAYPSLTEQRDYLKSLTEMAEQEQSTYE
jgi:hypothetical protein